MSNEPDPNKYEFVGEKPMVEGFLYYDTESDTLIPIEPQTKKDGIYQIYRKKGRMPFYGEFYYYNSNGASHRATFWRSLIDYSRFNHDNMFMTVHEARERL